MYRRSRYILVHRYAGIRVYYLARQYAPCESLRFIIQLRWDVCRPLWIWSRSICGECRAAAAKGGLGCRPPWNFEKNTCLCGIWSYLSWSTAVLVNRGWEKNLTKIISRQWQLGIILLSWHKVYDVAPTSNLRLFNVLCCLGITPVVNVNLTII